MPIARSPFFQQLPTVLLTFQASGPREAVVRRLLIDSGFTGKSSFVLSTADCARFRRRYAPPSQVSGALAGSHQRVWVKCTMSTIGFEANLVAISGDLAGCSLPAGVDGLAGLSFLSQFHRWGAQRMGGSDWEFFLETI